MSTGDQKKAPFVVVYRRKVVTGSSMLAFAFSVLMMLERKHSSDKGLFLSPTAQPDRKEGRGEHTAHHLLLGLSFRNSALLSQVSL